MANEKPTFQELFTEAEALWQKFSDLAQNELTGLVEGAGHEILMDIAKEREISWDNEVKNVAKLLYNQGEVVAMLDVLRQSEKRPDGDS
jgi:hypothetical protein